MEPKFSVSASFFLCMIMFSVMFTPVNGVKIKLSLDAISAFVQGHHEVLSGNIIFTRKFF